MRWNKYVFATAALCVALGTAAEPPAQVRDVDSLVFEGNSSISPQQLCGAVYFNLDLAEFARPNYSLAAYLATLKGKLAVAYQHSGFRVATIEAAYDADREKIVVRIDEGPRRLCGEIEVSGCPRETVQALRRALTTADDPDEILWQPGRPVPYDELTAEEMRSVARAVLADAGHFSPKFTCQIEDSGEDRSQLVFAVSDLGPPAQIGELRVTGAKRDDQAAILRFLDLRSGQPFHGQLGNQVCQRLLDSGRFLTADAPSARNSGNSTDAHEVYDLTIELQEFDFAPPLAEPLSAEEQALLRLSEWLARWQANQTPEDLVLVATYGVVPHGENWPANNATWIEQLKMRMVIAPRRGTALTVQAATNNQQPVVDLIAASLPDRLLLGSPLRNSKLEIPHGTRQLKITAESKGIDLRESPEGRPFALSCGVSWKSASQPDASPIEVELKLQPATLLALFQDVHIKCAIEQGVLTIERPGFRARLAAESGKPLEIAWTDAESGWTLSVAAAAGAFAAEQKNIEERLVGSRSAFDAAAPWHSLSCHLLDDVTFALDALDRAGVGNAEQRQRAAGYRALSKLVAAWRPPVSRDLLSMQDGKDEVPGSSFSLPRQLTRLDLDGLFAGKAEARINITGFVLGVLRRVLPQDGWLWPVCRDFALLQGQGQLQPGLDLQRLARAPDTGPLGEFFLSRLVTEGAAGGGLAKLSPKDFRHDYQPLLAGDSWLSELVLSLAEAARTLDEDELRAVAGLVDDAYTCELLATLLVSLKAQSDRPVADALAAALDEVWKQGLSDYLKVLLEAQLAGEKARLSQVLYPKTTAPKITPIEQPTPLSDQLKGLEALEEELKADRGNRTGNQAETPLTDALKRLEEQKKR